MLALRSRNRQTGAEGCRDGATIVQHYARSANPPPSALPRQRPPSTLSVLLVLSLIALIAAGAAASAASLGANKFDLMLDYVAPSPPAGANPEGYRRVRRAMAKKAIADARDAGLAFLHVGVTGYHPSELETKANDLAVWQNDPTRFWAALDEMFDDLDAAGMQLVPGFIPTPRSSRRSPIATSRISSAIRTRRAVDRSPNFCAISSAATRCARRFCSMRSGAN